MLVLRLLPAFPGPAEYSSSMNNNRRNISRSSHSPRSLLRDGAGVLHVLLHALAHRHGAYRYPRAVPRRGLRAVGPQAGLHRPLHLM